MKSVEVEIRNRVGAATELRELAARALAATDAETVRGLAGRQLARG